MDGKVYDYMDWPRIEAIVYGEETAPKDVYESETDGGRSADPGILSGCGEG